MDGRINVAKALEIMVSRRRPNPVEKANPASIPGPNSPLENTPHNAEDFKQGAPTHEGRSVERTGGGTLLKIPLC
jgi:hypothetical protein